MDSQPVQPNGQPENHTGLPDGLKAGVEALSGLSLDDVRVHYNSAKPARLRALAYTQGTEIHVGPGQERYLPHEAWHVVQQAQGRVKPTIQLKEGIPGNDDRELEQEADTIGTKALGVSVRQKRRRIQNTRVISTGTRVLQQRSAIVQRWPDIKSESGKFN